MRWTPDGSRERASGEHRVRVDSGHHTQRVIPAVASHRSPSRSGHTTILYGPRAAKGAPIHLHRRGSAGSANGRFHDRAEAGRLLAERLGAYARRDGVIVLGLPRGGVPVAFEVAQALAAPLDVFVVRKLGVPGREELALGAIASGGGRVVNSRLVEELGIPEDEVEAIEARERRELARRERDYRGERSPPDLAGRTAMLVDDGLATGSTMLAAVRAVQQECPAQLVVAVPVAPEGVCAALRREADDVVCLLTPAAFRSVGTWYRDFSQVRDDRVRSLLERSRQPSAQ
jgi:putative phosphoribosyl transferase